MVDKDDMIFTPGLIVNKNVLRKEADFVRGICGAHGGYGTAKVRDVWRIGVGRGLHEETEKRWVGRSLDGLRAFGINADQLTTAAQDKRKWRRTAEQGAERFMVK